MVGQVRAGSVTRDVTVLDLSEGGCRCHDRSAHWPEGSRVYVKLGPIGPLEAVVKWRERDLVGIRFVNPLYPPVLDHIRAHFDMRRK